MDRLKDKVCIVTGGAQSLGRAMAERFAGEGAKMVVVFDIQDTTFEQANIRFVKGSVTDRDACYALAKAVWDEFGRIDVLVNNAGVIRDAMTHKMTDDQWYECLDINLKGALYMTGAVGPYMMEQGTGSLIGLGSLAGMSVNFLLCRGVLFK